MFAINVKQLTVTYQESSILWDINFSIPDGLILGILGPNGAGKSTLLKALLGIITPLDGLIFFWGHPIEKVRSRIVYVPQRSSIVDWDFPITALDLVAMGGYGRLGGIKWLWRKERMRAYEALEKVEMLPFAHRQIGQLSGGQQQRIMLARAFSQGGDCYLLDEPFACIDMMTERTLLQLLKNLRDEGKTVICVHHDLSSVQEYFDWVILLNTCLIAVGPVKEVFNSENLNRTFGQNNVFLDEAIFKSKKKTFGLL